MRLLASIHTLHVLKDLPLVSLSQVYYYYTRYPRDPLYMKLLVAAVCTTDTVHQVSIGPSSDIGDAY